MHPARPSPGRACGSEGSWACGWTVPRAAAHGGARDACWPARRAAGPAARHRDRRRLANEDREGAVRLATGVDDPSGTEHDPVAGRLVLAQQPEVGSGNPVREAQVVAGHLPPQRATRVVVDQQAAASEPSELDRRRKTRGTPADDDRVDRRFARRAQAAGFRAGDAAVGRGRGAAGSPRRSRKRAPNHSSAARRRIAPRSSRPTGQDPWTNRPVRTSTEPTNGWWQSGRGTAAPRAGCSRDAAGIDPRVGQGVP